MTIIGLGFIITGSLLWFNKKPTVEASWWNESWQYRQAIEINKTVAAQTNVYITLTLNTFTASTSMQSDCGDFRFLTRDGKEHPYYIASGCRSASNVIHVFYDSIGIGRQTLYFYYGNPSASNGFSASDFATEATNYTIGPVQAEETGPGPVGYWSFDEGYGATAQDSSANNNDGTITGATWQEESMCVSGKCLYFDGTDDNIDAGSEAPLETTSAFTVSLWAKPITFGGVLASKDKQYFIQINNDGLFRAGIGDGVNWGQDTLGTAVGLNDWHHLVLVWDGSNYDTYLDGSIDQLDKNDGISSMLMNSQVFTVGEWTPGSTGDYTGFLDEIKIYPYARTPAQIKADYAAGMAGMGTKTGASATFGSRSDSWMTDGLVGYWKFDEPVGTYDDDNGFEDAADSSGNGNTGDANGNANTTAGKFGNGGEFDGTDDYLAIAESSALNLLTTEFTVSAWIKISETAVWYSIYDSGTQPGHWGFGLDGNGRVWITENGVMDYPANTEVSADIWHHVVVVKDSDIGENVRFYLDSALDGSAAISTVAQPSGNKRIGEQIDGTTDFDGQIDELRVYNRALSPDEVRRLYEWAPGPLVRYRLDEGSGGTAIDTGSAQDDGTITNAAWTTGKYGSALSFANGSDPRVAMPAALHPRFTVAAWIKAASYGQGGYGRIMQKGDSTGGFSFYPSTEEGEIEFSVVHNNGSNNDGIWQTPANTIEFGTWQHVAASWDGSTSGNTPTIYVNGVKQALTVDTAPAGAPDDTSATLYIGNRSGNDRDFDGLIDDFQIFDYILTPKQVVNVMNGRDPGDSAIGSPVGSFLAAWNFDEGQGTAVQDRSQNDKDLTLSGATHRTLDGRTGYAFDGATNRRAADGADDADLDFAAADDFALSAWVKRSSISAAEYIIDKHDDSGYEGYALYMDSAGKLAFGVSDTSSGSFPEDSAVSSSDYDDGAWHHVLGVKTGSSKIELYVDGELSASDPSLAADATLENSAVLYVGDNNATDGTDEFLGLIDDVRIYNFALDADEAAILFNQGVASVMGSGTASGTASGLSAPDWSKAKSYCVPGDSSLCRPPVGEWKMDELSGTTAYDTSGNGNDGSLGGGTAGYMPAWQNGKLGGALQFAGTDDYVRVSSGYFSAYPFTLSGWVKVGVLASDSAFFGLADKDVANKMFGVYVDSSPAGTVKVLAQNTTAYETSATTLVNDDKWHFISAVFASDAERTLYIDSREEGTGTDSVSMTSANLDIFDLGRWGDSTPGSYFTGIVDHVRIYDYARTPAQIAWEYNRGAPVAHWTFDECQGDTIHDESGNGNHGTVDLGASGVTALGTCASSSASFWYNGRTGKLNAGGSFDGTDDYVSLPWTGGPNNIGDQSSFTLSGWLKTDNGASTEGMVYFERDSTGSAMNMLQMNDNGSGGLLTWSQIDDGSARNDLSYAGGLNDGAWHHFAIVRSAEIAALYVDGIPRKESASFSFGASISCDTAMIGSHSAVSGWYDGLVDDIKVNHNALTAEQVKTEYAGGAVRFE